MRDRQGERERERETNRERVFRERDANAGVVFVCMRHRVS